TDGPGHFIQKCGPTKEELKLLNNFFPFMSRCFICPLIISLIVNKLNPFRNIIFRADLQY
ncbi:MAG: hypothetical protein QN785_07015, partial [Nitrososphaeraceae archaeon]|nr:hypothetical protein [Nitrososphaeraceae archaeon]